MFFIESIKYKYMEFKFDKKGVDVTVTIEDEEVPKTECFIRHLSYKKDGGLMLKSCIIPN